VPQPGWTVDLPVVHPIAAPGEAVLASRYVIRHQAGSPYGGRCAHCRQIATPPGARLAAARLEPPGRSPAAARGGGQARSAARRVDGADPAGPQH